MKRRWAVSSEQDVTPDGRIPVIEVASMEEALDLIVNLAIIDPVGVHKGLYGIDGPESEDE